ncbi:MAG: hypothetical protein EX260_08615 [Desulfobulbaceae bacterium]|nr:MAG: hypothetical protein EX260_08615 [Desulfobulbaceae bacterium]
MISTKLTDEDLYAFGVAWNVLELLLNSPTITSAQARNLRDAANAIDALPESIPDGEWQFGIVYRSSPPTGMHYIEFTICDAWFQISRGGSEQYEGIGHDSYSMPDWLVEWDGVQQRDLYLDDLISSVEEFLALGAEIVARDEVQ